MVFQCSQIGETEASLPGAPGKIRTLDMQSNSFPPPGRSCNLRFFALFLGLSRGVGYSNCLLVNLIHHLCSHWPLGISSMPGPVTALRQVRQKRITWAVSRKVDWTCNPTFSPPEKLRAMDFLWIIWHCIGYRDCGESQVLSFPASSMQLVSCLPRVKDPLNLCLNFPQRVFVHASLLIECVHGRKRIQGFPVSPLVDIIWYFNIFLNSQGKGKSKLIMYLIIIIKQNENYASCKIPATRKISMQETCSKYP